MASRLSHFHAELHRRRVYRTAAVYCALGAGIIGVAEPLLDDPVWDRLKLPVLIIIILGLPVTLILAWLLQVRREEPAGADGTEPTDPPDSSGDPGLSIVVMPFDNLSPDPNDAYFSDGLTEEIITDLSFLRSLKVISRSSAMALKGTQKDVRTIGKELNVQYVLEGSVRKAGDDLRITAQLIDANTDAHLWAERYDGRLKDVFGIQEEFSRAIVAALKIELGAEEEHQLSANPIGDPQAHDHFMKAMHELRVASPEALERSLDNLQRAREIVGENAQVSAGMALVHFYYVDTMAGSTKDHLDKAEQLAWRSLKLDPRSSFSHHLLGRVERYRGTAGAAVRHFSQALRIDPNDTESLLWHGWMSSLFLGKPALAREAAERLVELDPLTPFRHVPLAWIEWMESRYDSALRHLDESLEECPEFRWPLFFKTQLLARIGKTDEALHAIALAAEQDPDDTVTALCSLFRSALTVEAAVFTEQLTDSLRDLLWDDPECPFWLAGWCTLLGQKDEALNWLERAIERGWINYPLLAQDDPFLEGIRAEPRFVQLVNSIKPNWEEFEA